ncbi:MAG TPA: Asp-tRNA(Asn)/Glu-tRNA(Gln) amidotransferase subunit GatC [Candidatus Nanoarchaeia archaeon]|nr:Asp-tRNA(Asn)/Glu-tRNA(Gln) amidotransferase subunit GatC [Candidatus Nanoarchaeia archaeon]
MKVDKVLIEKVASLARLELTEQEKTRFVPQFEEILDAFSKLDEVDTKDTKPSFHPVEIKNALREDKIQESLSQEIALKNSKNVKDGYFKGPKAV